MSRFQGCHVAWKMKAKQSKLCFWSFFRWSKAKQSKAKSIFKIKIWKQSKARQSKAKQSQKIQKISRKNSELWNIDYFSRVPLFAKWNFGLESWGLIKEGKKILGLCGNFHFKTWKTQNFLKNCRKLLKLQKSVSHWSKAKQSKVGIFRIPKNPAVGKAKQSGFRNLPYFGQKQSKAKQSKLARSNMAALFGAQWKNPRIGSKMSHCFFAESFRSGHKFKTYKYFNLIVSSLWNLSCNLAYGLDKNGSRANRCTP